MPQVVIRAHGELGPVVRAAFPELEARSCPQQATLRLTTDSPADLTRLLRALQDQGVSATEVRAVAESAVGDGQAVPG